MFPSVVSNLIMGRSYFMYFLAADCMSSCSFIAAAVKARMMDVGCPSFVKAPSLYVFGLHVGAQAVSMMNIFTFGDSKMKALRLMAPHIIDLQNAIIIYQQFNFESEKQKVGEILRSSR